MISFQWPQGARPELKVYPADHPQRKPTEAYFAGVVRNDIRDIRNGAYINLWLMIEALKDLKDPQPQHFGFHTFLWAIQGVLGDDSCRAIGEQVCISENFTLEEAEELMEKWRRQRNVKHGFSKRLREFIRKVWGWILGKDKT